MKHHKKKVRVNDNKLQEKVKQCEVKRSGGLPLLLLSGALASSPTTPLPSQRPKDRHKQGSVCAGKEVLAPPPENTRFLGRFCLTKFHRVFVVECRCPLPRRPATDPDGPNMLELSQCSSFVMLALLLILGGAVFTLSSLGLCCFRPSSFWVVLPFLSFVERPQSQ